MARSRFNKTRSFRSRNVDLEAIAQRGPWGHIVVIPDPVTGQTTKQRVSFAGIMRRLAAEAAPKPAPRADKGIAYAGGGYKMVNARRIGIPRTIVRG